MSLSAVVFLKNEIIVPDVSKVGGGGDPDASTPKRGFRVIVCYPRRATSTDQKKTGISMQELLAVDTNADGVADYSFCVPDAEIQHIFYAHNSAAIEDVATVISFDSAYIDVRAFDIGHSGGSGDITELPVFEQLSPGAGSEEDLYTVPDGKTARITSIFIANRSAATTFRISISKAGAATTDKDYTHYNIPISANSTLLVDIPEDGLPLSAGDVVRVYAAAATLSFTASGKEYS